MDLILFMNVVFIQGTTPNCLMLISKSFQVVCKVINKPSFVFENETLCAGQRNTQNGISLVGNRTKLLRYK